MITRVAYRHHLLRFVMMLFFIQGISAVELSLVQTGTIEVLPGDTINYTIHYANTGTDTATGVSILDTVPVNVQFIKASDPFNYHPGIPPTIEWELGELTPGESGNVSLQLRSSSDLEDEEQIVNRAWIFSDQGVSNTATARTSNVLPMTINVSANPTIIPGDGVSSSTLTATVVSYLGNPVPDGIPVSFTEDIGTIPVGEDTAYSQGGIAHCTLISDIMIYGSKGAIVNGRANFSDSQFSSDTTRVVFLMGALSGTVVDYSSGTPVPDAVVDLIREDTGNSIHSDTTGLDGRYKILVHVRDDYLLAFSTVDEFGDPVKIEQLVTIELPDSGLTEPSLNSLSGWLYNENSGERIEEAGIPVSLSSQNDTTGLSKTGEGVAHFDTTYTDSGGFYDFTNIPPGKYEVNVFYLGELSYHDGQIGVDLSIPGYYMTDVNVPLVRSPFYSYKTVDRSAAEIGDTLTYTIYYGSIDTDISDRVYVVDNLPKELTFIEDENYYHISPSVRFDSYNPLDNTITFYRDRLFLNEPDSIIFRARVDGDMSSIDPLSKTGYITNTDFVTNKEDTTFSSRDSRGRARTKLYLDLLSVKKEVNHRAAEPGDMLTYTVRIKNTSDEITIHEITVYDVLPYGFRYRSQRSFWNSEKIDDPSEESRNQRVRLVWALDDTLNPGESGVLKYRVIVGLSSRYGENENRVYATSITESDVLIHSQTTAIPVVIRPGMLNNLGLIFGKVYYDLNLNTLHDSDEPVVGNVEIILEDGTRVTTDEFGKYSIPNIRSGDHVLRINRSSLPPQTRVLLNSADFLGDPRSRLVDVSPGGIAKANFALETIPEIIPEPEPEIRQDLGLALSEVTKIKMRQYPSVGDFRLIVQKPVILTLQTEFLPGEAAIQPEMLPELIRIADFLDWRFDSNVEITGYTDNILPPPSSPFSNNSELSRARADSVKAYLDRERGILPNRMTTTGRGDRDPIADNSTEEGRTLNRRIEFRFVRSTEEIAEQQELRFHIALSYSDDLPLNQVRLRSIIPQGWTYSDNSGSLNGSSINPAMESNRYIIWDLGEWRDQIELDLEFGLVPLDYTQIQSVSALTSVLEYTYPGGAVAVTDSVITSIATMVQEILFRIIIPGATFDVNLWDIKPAAIVFLAPLGDFLNWQTDLDITIQGYTDSTGTMEWNMELSGNRATSARDHLAQVHGIATERMAVEGLGPQFPVATNSTVDGRTLNRRVEFIINSNFQQPVTLDIVVLDDSLEHEVSTIRDLTDPPSREAFRVVSGDTSKLRLYIDFYDLTDIDSVKVTFGLPEGFLIEGVSDEGYRSDLQSWMFAVQRGQARLVRDFSLMLDSGIRGRRAVQVRVQPYSNHEEKYGLTERTANFRIE